MNKKKSKSSIMNLNDQSEKRERDLDVLYKVQYMVHTGKFK